MYNLLITQTAKQQYDDIAMGIFEKSQSVDVALDFVKRLRASVEHLKEFPFSGALPQDRLLLSVGYRYTVFEDYLTFYKADENLKTVTIFAVLNAKLDYKRFMKKYLK